MKGRFQVSKFILVATGKLHFRKNAIICILLPLKIQESNFLWVDIYKLIKCNHCLILQGIILDHKMFSVQTKDILIFSH